MYSQPACAWRVVGLPCCAARRLTVAVVPFEIPRHAVHDKPEQPLLSLMDVVQVDGRDSAGLAEVRCSGTTGPQLRFFLRAAQLPCKQPRRNVLAPGLLWRCCLAGARVQLSRGPHQPGARGAGRQRQGGAS